MLNNYIECDESTSISCANTLKDGNVRTFTSIFQLFCWISFKTSSLYWQNFM